MQPNGKPPQKKEEDHKSVPTVINAARGAQSQLRISSQVLVLPLTEKYIKKWRGLVVTDSAGFVDHREHPMRSSTIRSLFVIAASKDAKQKGPVNSIVITLRVAFYFVLIR